MNEGLADLKASPFKRHFWIPDASLRLGAAAFSFSSSPALPSVISAPKEEGIPAKTTPKLPKAYF